MYFLLAHSSITGDLGYPEQQRFIEQTEALEKSYQQQKNQEYKTTAPESVAPPQFKTPIKDQQNIKEGGFAHFEARLEPLGDSTLQVEWLKDGKPVEASTYKLYDIKLYNYYSIDVKYLMARYGSETDCGVATRRYAVSRLISPKLRDFLSPCAVSAYVPTAL